MIATKNRIKLKWIKDEKGKWLAYCGEIKCSVGEWEEIYKDKHSKIRYGFWIDLEKLISEHAGYSIASIDYKSRSSAKRGCERFLNKLLDDLMKGVSPALWKAEVQTISACESLTLKQAAVRLGKPESFADVLRKQIHNEKLKAAKHGSCWFVNPKEVARYKRETMKR